MTTLLELAQLHGLPPHQGGGDKHHHSYIPVYERHITRRRAITLLEIGVWQGNSIRMWNDYFTQSVVHGIDIDLTRLTTPIEGVMGCDATNRTQCDEVLGDWTYDYIIDDASHTTQDILAAWHNLNHRLRPQGKYFIEDIRGDQIQPILDTIKPAQHEIHHSFDYDIMLIIST